MKHHSSVLTLDSRNRVNVGQPNNCQFALQDTVMASRFELSNFQFANNLYNIQTGSNNLYISGVLAATSTPQFWVATAYITDLNTQLKTYFATVADVVTLDTSTNKLTWVLPSGSISNNVSSMNRVLGLLGSESGSFTSTLFLVGPLQLGIQSPTLSCSSYNSNGTTAAVLGVIPVNSGFLEVQYYDPDRDWQLKFEPRVSFNLLNIIITDNRTGLVAEGLGEWCAAFVVY